MLLVNKNIREQATWTEFEKNIRQSRIHVIEDKEWKG